MLSVLKKEKKKKKKTWRAIALMTRIMLNSKKKDWATMTNIKMFFTIIALVCLTWTVLLIEGIRNIFFSFWKE